MDSPVIKSHLKDIIPAGIKFAINTGRMKLCRPVFRDLYAWDEARTQTVEAFKEHRHRMHETTANMVAKDLQL